jgi:glycosyltransferase involved in cell wall biosynthesis
MHKDSDESIGGGHRKGLDSGKLIDILGFVLERGGYVRPVPYYRVAGPLAAIDRNSNSLNVKVLTDSEFKKAYVSGTAADVISSTRVLFMSRLHYQGQGKDLDDFVDACKKYNITLVFDTDDDLTHRYRDLGQSGGQAFLDTMSRMDYVTVSTPYLKTRVEEETGQNATVIENHVHYDWFSEMSLKTDKMAGGVTVGFIGTHTHKDDWIYPVKALERLASKYDDVVILCAGFVPAYLRDMDNIIKLDSVPYPMYPTLIRQFDIVCCSLDPDDKFNWSKSGIKALEAMASSRELKNGRIGGAVPVCTDMKLYRRVVNNNNNGLLVDNDSWFDALELLIRDGRKRDSLAIAGNKWVKKHRDFDRGYRKWLRFFKEVVL